MSCSRFCGSGSSANRKTPERVMNKDCTANILIVDDDVKSLTAMEDLLAGPGREIVKDASEAEALPCLLRRHFSLIVLDVRLLDTDGFGTAMVILNREPSRDT